MGVCESRGSEQMKLESKRRNIQTGSGEWKTSNAYNAAFFWSLLNFLFDLAGP